MDVGGKDSVESEVIFLSSSPIWTQGARYTSDIVMITDKWVFRETIWLV